VSIYKALCIHLDFTNAAAATLETKKKWKVNFILTLNFGTLSSSFDTVV
jgi:hypothetical protein